MLTGAVAVTGAGSGLGRVASLHIAGTGRPVALLDRNLEAAGAVEKEILASGGKAAAIACDVTDADMARSAFQAAVNAFGTVYGLVNNAGVYARKPILEITKEDWDFNFSVNVRGTYNMMVAAIEHMSKNGGGRIVNVASVDAFKAHPKNAHYAATKAAVVNLTRSFALEFAPQNILINGVAPAGFVSDTAKAAGFLGDMVAPVGRVAVPEDMASVIEFFLSDASRFVVGETIAVSGGRVFR